MLNTEFIGRSLPATEPREITADAVSAFRLALGHPDDTAVPPTFLISLTLPAAQPLIDDPDFGLDFSRVLHREQRFHFTRPVWVGDRVTCAVTVDSIKTVAGNDLLGLRTDVADDTGADLATVWTTLFVAGETA